MALDRNHFSFKAQVAQYSELPHDDTDCSVPRAKKSVRLAFLLHVLIISVYTAILIFSLFHGHWGTPCGMKTGKPSANRQSPLHMTSRAMILTAGCTPGTLPGLQLKYHDHIQTFDTSLYSGLPTSELDRNWDSLMSTMRIRVSDEELAARDQTSVPLSQGGNLAWLGVYHQLHCVVRIQSGRAVSDSDERR